MNNSKRAILIALIVILLVAVVPMAALACENDEDCGCTDALPYCCQRNSSGVGNYCAFTRQDEIDWAATNQSSSSPSTSAPASTVEVFCKRRSPVPMIGGYTIGVAQAMVDANTDICPDTYYRAWPGNWYKVVYYVPK